eukprot:11166924-Lingulodinium_polyedra.AAC.1
MANAVVRSLPRAKPTMANAHAWLPNTAYAGTTYCVVLLAKPPAHVWYVFAVPPPPPNARLRIHRYLGP